MTFRSSAPTAAIERVYRNDTVSVDLFPAMLPQGQRGLVRPGHTVGPGDRDSDDGYGDNEPEGSGGGGGGDDLLVGT